MWYSETNKLKIYCKTVGLRYRKEYEETLFVLLNMVSWGLAVPLAHNTMWLIPQSKYNERIIYRKLWKATRFKYFIRPKTRAWHKNHHR